MLAKPPGASRVALLFLISAALAACGGDDGSSSPSPGPTPPAPPPFAGPSQATCEALASAVGDASVFPAQTKVRTAAFVPAVAASGNTPATPEHCDIVGTIREARAGQQSSPGVTQTYAINWRVRLPTEWNGRSAMQGGGGLNGSVPNNVSPLTSPEPPTVQLSAGLASP